MAYLTIAVCMNIAIFLSFRSFERFGIGTFNAIVVNYLMCIITGILFYVLSRMKSENLFHVQYFWGPCHFLYSF